jgi:hypothetical protein
LKRFFVQFCFAEFRQGLRDDFLIQGGDQRGLIGKYAAEFGAAETAFLTERCKREVAAVSEQQRSRRLE